MSLATRGSLYAQWLRTPVKIGAVSELDLHGIESKRNIKAVNVIIYHPDLNFLWKPTNKTHASRVGRGGDIEGGA